ncbi:MAG TPA: allantoinase AllB [Polyangia bacterium]|nr:allantoinase AllB [Polyangia bacterium]
MRLGGVRSTRVLLADGHIAPATVLFDDDGRISEVRRERVHIDHGDADTDAGAGGGISGGELMDVGDLLVSPGIVDCHVHINEPGRTDWEGFGSATRAAAAGGVTTLVDMPLNCIPVTTSAAALEVKRAACLGQLHADVGFWGGVVPGNTGELAGLAEAGALGCKAFLVHSGIDEFPNATEADLRRAMPVLRDHGLPLLAHAELDLGAEVSEPDPRAYRGYLQSRPAAWEDEAIRLLVRLSRDTGCAVHVVHLSSASSLPTLHAARAEGLPFTVETCPHYLCLEAEAIPDGATQFKCAPPIRGHANREELWRGLRAGEIDLVITDHSPCAPALKLAERGDFHAAWGGIASLQLGLPAVWTEARRRGLGPAALAGWMSAAPARLAGLSDRKGRIAPGLDADLVIWDPEATHTFGPGDLHLRHKISPYLGATLHGRVHSTVLRGEIVFDGRGFPAGPTGRTLLGRAPDGGYRAAAAAAGEAA